MPIICRPAAEEPLFQGDILADVPFPFLTDEGRVSADSKARFVIVISRPCKALRDKTVVVAPVFQQPLDIGKLNEGSPGESLDRYRRFLSGYRDGISGVAYIDLMYLGTLDESGGKRYAAQLSTLGTIAVPAAADERQAFIRKKRVARLAPDFIRDLHSRLTSTYTKLGFEDVEWLCDADLAMMITAGEADLAALELILKNAQFKVQAQEAGNRQVSQHDASAVTSAKEKHERVVSELQQYKDERDRRRPK